MDDLDQILSILRQGYWSASVYHRPPSRKYPGINNHMNAASITLTGKYPDAETAIEAAKGAIQVGRVSIGQFIHGPSAIPCARFNLDQSKVEELARLAQAIEARRDVAHG